MEIAVIDAGVAAPDTLVHDLPAGMETVRLTAGEDGLKTLAAHLRGRTGLTAIHLFSHGAPGKIQLGNRWLDQAALAAHAEDLATIRDALAPGADLLLYGCHVAQGERGAEFIDALAKLTAADIAASDNLTGHVRHDGDWHLEAHHGFIDSLLTATASLADYPHVLTVETFESESSEATTFSEGGVTFSITSQAAGPFRIQTSFPGFGWNGSSSDNVFIDNDGNAAGGQAVGFTLSSASDFTVSSFYLYLGDNFATLVGSGTVTIAGYNNSVLLFSASSSGGFNTDLGSQNGFSLINLSTFGGQNNASTVIDQLVITTNSTFNYVALDAFNFTAVTSPTITSATYDASAGSLVVTGTNFSATVGATNDVIANKITVTGEGGATATLTSTSNVEIDSGTQFTLTLSTTDRSAVNQILNKNGTSSTGGTTYKLEGAAGFIAASASTADLTGNGVTVSNALQPPTAGNSSLTVSYNASATNVSLSLGGGAATSLAITSAAANGTALVSGTSITYQPTAGFAGSDSFSYTASNSSGTSAPATVSITVNDPVITITPSGGFTATEGSAYTQTFTFNGGAPPWSGYQVTNQPAGLSITATSSNSVTLSGTPQQSGGFNLNVSATDTSTGNGPYSVGQAFALTVNPSPLSISNLAGDSVAWAGAGGSVALDASSAASLTHTSLSSLNSGNGDWSGATVTVSRAGGAISSDTLGFNASGALFTVSGSNLQSGGLTFATFTNTGGTLAVSFTSSGTIATTLLVNNVVQRITYRNDTPGGDATVRFSVSDGSVTKTADVTVTSDTLYVTNSTDTSAIDVTDGVSFSEAIGIAAADATGSQTIVFDSSLAATALTIDSLTLNESLTFDFDAASGISLTTGTITLGSGTLTLTNGTGDTATFSGNLDGTGNLAKAGAGTITLSGANSFSGSTTISGGTLGSTSLPNTSGITIDGGTLASSGSSSFSSPAPVVFGSSGATINLSNFSVTLSGAVTGTGALTVNSSNGGNVLSLTNASNTFSGGTTLNNGILQFGANNAFGTGTITTYGGKLRAAGVTARSFDNDIVIHGTFTMSGSAALTLNGDVDLNGGATINNSISSDLTINGVLSNGSLTVNNQGSGTLLLNGTNTHAGGTTLTLGTLASASADALGTGSLVLNGGTLSLSGATTFAQAVSLTAGSTVTNSAAVTFSGVVSGGAVTLTKAGTGTLTLSNTNTHSGTISVSGGTLAVTGVVAGDITVASAATLAGTGAVNGAVTIQSGGTLAPGNGGPGIFGLGNGLSIQSGGTLAVDVAGSNAGSGYDILMVTGAVDVSSATLAVTHSYTPGSADAYLIIDNNASDAITGTFSGLSQGALITAAGNSTPLLASYVGNTGNDFTLTAPVIPAVTSVSATTANGTYNAGDGITVTVSFDQSVTVNTTGGTTTLTLETGTTDRAASYASGSGTTTLTFNYTVQAGDNSADLDYVSTSALALNSGTIRSALGVNASLTLPAPGAAGSLAANKALVIDTTAPAAPTAFTGGASGGTVSLSWTNPTSDFASVTIRRSTTSFPANISSGTAVVSGSTGTTYSDAALAEGLYYYALFATDDAGNVSAAATTTVLVDTTAPDSPAAFIAVVSGGTVALSWTNPADPDFASVSIRRSNSGFPATAGAGTAVLSNSTGNSHNDTPPADGQYYYSAFALDNAGNISAAAQASAVIDTTTPSAPSAPDLSSASDNGVSSTDNITSLTTPTFTGTAEAYGTVHLYDTDGTTVLGTDVADSSGNWSITSSALTPGTHGVTAKVTDTSGNTSAASASLAVIIADLAPLVTTSTGATAFIEAVDLASTPVAVDDALTVSDADSPTLASGSVAITTNFQTAEDQLELIVDSLTMGDIAATYDSASGVLTLASAGAAATKAQWQAALRAVTYTNHSDTPTTAPRTLRFLLNDGALGGAPATKTLTLTAANDSPQASLLGTGTTSQSQGVNAVVDTLTATDPESDTPITYTLVAGGGDMGNAWFNIDGSTLRANDARTIPGGSYSIRIRATDAGGAYSEFTPLINILDDITATVSSVSSSMANGTYKSGDTLALTVSFPEIVFVTGTPALALQFGGYTASATYAGGSGTATLVFNYTVQTGDQSADLDYASTTALTLNGGAIRDIASQPADLTLPAPGAAGSLGANKALVIDGFTTAGSLNNPSDNSHRNATLALAFSLPEAALSGSLRLTFVRTGGNADPASPHVAVLSNSLGTAGSHTATLDLANLAASPAVTAVTGGNALVDGSVYVAYLTYQDNLGNPPNSDARSFTYDNSITTPATPAVAATSDTGRSATDGITRDPAPTVTGTAEPFSTVTIRVDGSVLVTLVLDATGNWSAAINNLSTTGAHTVTAQAVDRAGNTSAVSPPLTFVLDFTPPAAPAITAISTDNGASPVDFITSDPTLILSGTAEADALVTLTRVGTGVIGTATADSAGAWSFDYSATTLATGTHSFTATATDVAGNVSAASGARNVTILAFPTPAPDGYAAGVTGGAGAGSQAVFALNAADFRTYAESTTPYVITVSGILNLGTTPVAVKPNKTIQGADAGATLVGNLSLGSGVSNVIIRGLSLTHPGTTIVGGAYTDGGDAITITGASNIFITHCSFFDCADHALEVTGAADNLTISWCEFDYTSAQTAHRHSMLIGSSTQATAIKATLHHNRWGAGVDRHMPAATYGYVHLYNNLFNTPGNTTGTEALDQSQLLSERNVYTSIATPLSRRQVNTALPIGRILALGNSYTSVTGTPAYTGTDSVFTPTYAYEMLPASDVATEVLAYAGNIAGAASTDAATGTATVTGPTAAVTPGTAFTLTSAATGFTPASYQWRRNNLDIAGATGATYTVASAQSTDAALYTVAIAMSTGDVVVSRPFTVTLGAAPVTPSPTPAPAAPSGGGGGGAPSLWFVAALATLAALRTRCRRGAPTPHSR